MQVQRFGETSHMTWRVISGLLVVYSTNQLHWSLHSGLMTCKVYTRKSSEVSTPRSQTISPVIWRTSQSNLFKYKHSLGLHASRFFRCLLLSAWERSFSWMISIVRTFRVKMNFWVQLGSPRISFTSLIDYLNQCMTQQKNLDTEVWTKRRREGLRRIQINFLILPNII